MAILTISREYGSGGREIGRRVAQRLSFEFVDKERLFQDLDQAGNAGVRQPGIWTKSVRPSGSAMTGNITGI